MGIKTKLLARLLFSADERRILASATRTSRKAERTLFGYNKKILIAVSIMAMLCVSIASAVVYLTQTVNMSFRLKVTYGLAVEDASNIAQASISYGEFDFSQKKNASNIDHLKNLSTEAIIVRYVVTVPSGWSVKVYDSQTTVWLSTDSKTIAYGSTMFLRVELCAPSSGQSTPQVGSIAFNVVDA